MEELKKLMGMMMKYQTPMMDGSHNFSGQEAMRLLHKIRIKLENCK